MAERRTVTLAAGERDIATHLRTTAASAVAEAIWNSLDADAIGSVLAWTDTLGVLSGTATYDPFGSVTATTGNPGRFGYAGELSDPTGLIYLRSRYLDPATSRFLTRDSLQPNAPGTQGFGWYSYTANNPTTYRDPTGRSPLLENEFLTAAALSGTSALLTAPFTCGQPSWENLDCYARVVVPAVVAGGAVGGLSGPLIGQLSGAGFFMVACALGGASEVGAGAAIRGLQGVDTTYEDVYVDLAVGCVSALIGGGGGSAGGRQAIRDAVGNAFGGGRSPAWR